MSDNQRLVVEAFTALKYARRSLVRARSIANDSDDDELRAAIASAIANIDKAAGHVFDIGCVLCADSVAADPLPPACSFVYVISFDPDAEPQTGTCAFMPEEAAR